MTCKPCCRSASYYYIAAMYGHSDEKILLHGNRVFSCTREMRNSMHSYYKKEKVRMKSKMQLRGDLLFECRTNGCQLSSTYYVLVLYHYFLFLPLFETWIDPQFVIIILCIAAHLHSCLLWIVIFF